MLTWTVEGHPVPDLRMWTAGGGRMLLTQADRPVLIARVAEDHCDVEYLRTNLYRSPVAPITAAQARRRAPGRIDGWAEHFRAGMADSDAGPLRDGAWAILPAAVAVPAFGPSAGRDPFGPGCALTDAEGELDWFGMQVHLLPLRPVPGPDEGRVKAYRKLAREGSLPPVLTWWVTGLQALVVVDGLARLSAAWAEGIPATVLTLVEVDPARVTADVGQAVAFYEKTTHGIRNLTGDRADRAHTYLSRHLAEALQVALTSGISRAWPLPGGTAQWQATAEAHGWQARGESR